MKKLVSILIVLCLVLSCSSYALAAEPAVSENSYWGFDGTTIEIDEFTTDAYSMKSFYDGEIVYVITVLANGQTEFAWAPIGGEVRTLIIDAHDLSSYNSHVNTASLSYEQFTEAVKDYSLSHIAESTIVYEQISTTEMQLPGNAETNAMIEADYEALMEQIEDIHGAEHVMHNWAGMTANIVGGLTFEYKENLDYGINYRNSVAYSANMTLGALVAKILSFIPGIGVPMNIIATVLEVAAATNTVLYESGRIASYYGSAVYCRFVLVEGGGPYFESYWSIDYDGWVKEGEPGSAVLVETGEYYNPTEELFENYVLQRQRATENYNAYN